jgi:hypothetical protein
MSSKRTKIEDYSLSTRRRSAIVNTDFFRDPIGCAVRTTEAIQEEANVSAAPESILVAELVDRCDAARGDAMKAVRRAVMDGFQVRTPEGLTVPDSAQT